jgi:hypothetical protein
MNAKGRQLLAVSASAASVAALEVLLVAAARRLRSAAGMSASPSSDRAYHWAHLVLAEALGAFQADLVQRQLRASLAERALVQQKGRNSVVPPQGRSLHFSAQRLGVLRPRVPSSRSGGAPSLVARDKP